VKTLKVSSAMLFKLICVRVAVSYVAEGGLVVVIAGDSAGFGGLKRSNWRTRPRTFVDIF
jgi:hypothetical protein